MYDLVFTLFWILIITIFFNILKKIFEIYKIKKTKGNTGPDRSLGRDGTSCSSGTKGNSEDY